MAKYVPTNPVTKKITQGIPSPFTQEIIEVAGKAIRFKIIADRYTRGFEQADIDGGPGSYQDSGLPLMATEKTKREQQLEKGKIGREQVEKPNNSNYTFEVAGKRKPGTPLVDSISIVDIDYKDEQKTTRGYSYITLPFVPREISYQPSSKFVGIATMGRNTPYYNFTGSEDSLQFDIDWFASNEDRQDVINSCRWVEALTKADGYSEAPHRVKLVWGKDDLLWQGDTWLIVEAPYTLSDFVKGQRNQQTGEIQRLGLMPQQAIQKITLKRVVGHNMRASEIIGKLSKSTDYGR